jgi:hypothetical protein
MSESAPGVAPGILAGVPTLRPPVAANGCLLGTEHCALAGSGIVGALANQVAGQPVRDAGQRLPGARRRHCPDG